MKLPTCWRDITLQFFKHGCLLLYYIKHCLVTFSLMILFNEDNLYHKPKCLSLCPKISENFYFQDKKAYFYQILDFLKKCRIQNENCSLKRLDTFFMKLIIWLITSILPFCKGKVGWLICDNPNFCNHPVMFVNILISKLNLINYIFNEYK